jgi:hypothetical protein
METTMGPPRTDRTADPVREGLAVLFDPADVVELRALDCPRGNSTTSGYFDDFDKLAEAALSLSGRCPGVYVTLNPVNPALLARSANEVRPWAKETTKDHDVPRRRHLLLDFDPVRPSGIPATDAEHAAALARARQCRDYLGGCGFPAPAEEDSGNGAYLIYGVDLANNEGALALVNRCLEAVDYLFGDGEVSVDTTVGNAARLCRLPGTLNRKGTGSADRPHRTARLLGGTLRPDVVPTDLLEALAAMGPPEEPARNTAAANSNGAGPFDVSAWIARHNLPIAYDGRWSKGHKWVLKVCPFNEEHTDRSACIVRFASGAVSFKCHHAGCAGKKWPDLRRLYEPGCYDRPEGNGRATGAGFCSQPRPGFRK